MSAQNRRYEDRVIIGLTGGLGSGKTTVAKMLAKRGAYVIDADKIVHQIIDAPTRKKLAEVVFDDCKAMERLCRKVHPLVKMEILRQLQELGRDKTAVIDAPLLIESGFHKKCDYLVVVKASLRKQLERAKQSLAITREEAMKRIRLQMPLREKIALADFVIDNGGPLSDTEKQVKKLWEEILEKETE